jgi:hypothetical protein
MDSIQNNLKPEVKEETEEEKIDSCDEHQLTRSVC